MEITGQVTWAGPVESGTSKQGNQWTKQSFVVEYQKGQYPNDILLDTFDDKIVGKIQVGQTLNVKFDFKVRDYTKRDGTPGKLNNINAWEIHCVSQPSNQQQIFKEPQLAAQQQQQQNAQSTEKQADDLPF